MQLIFDAHLDMAWNAVEWNRDLTLPVSEINQFESQYTRTVPEIDECVVSWHELRRGRVGMTISTLLPRLHRKDAPQTHYQSREAAYGACYGQLAYYRAMVEAGHLREVSNLATLEEHVAEWESDQLGEESPLPIGFILSMEGSPSVLSPQQIGEWYEAGLRILGPAHYGPGPYCFGTGSEGGLRDGGKELLEEMDRVGMILDVTHLADQSFWEALDIYQGPVLASHHNCRALAPGDRQLDDEQIKELIKRDAVIGAAFDNWMVKPGWVRFESDPGTIGMADIVDHIDHICQLAGSTKHCGIGTDLDGGFGTEQCPRDLKSIADLQKMEGLLRERGYSESDVEGIMYRNWLDLFRRAWS